MLVAVVGRRRGRRRPGRLPAVGAGRRGGDPAGPAARRRVGLPRRSCSSIPDAVAAARPSPRSCCSTLRCRCRDPGDPGGGGARWRRRSTAPAPSAGRGGHDPAVRSAAGRRCARGRAPTRRPRGCSPRGARPRRWAARSRSSPTAKWTTPRDLPPDFLRRARGRAPAARADRRGHGGPRSAALVARRRHGHGGRGRSWRPTRRRATRRRWSCARARAWSCREPGRARGRRQLPPRAAVRARARRPPAPSARCGATRPGVAGVTGDAEPRDDARTTLAEVTRTSTIALFSDSPDWDFRTLASTLRRRPACRSASSCTWPAGPWRDAATLQARSRTARWRRRRATPRWWWCTARPRAAAILAALARHASGGGRRRRAARSAATGTSRRPMTPVAHGSALAGVPADSLPPLEAVAEQPADTAEWTAVCGATRPPRAGPARDRGLGGGRAVASCGCAGSGLWRWASKGGVAAEGIPLADGGDDRLAARPSRRARARAWPRSATPSPVVSTSCCRGRAPWRAAGEPRGGRGRDGAGAAGCRGCMASRWWRWSWSGSRGDGEGCVEVRGET